MEKALAKTDFPDDQVALIKRTVAHELTDDELQVFLYTARRTGLDPLAGQIHAVKRWNKTKQKKVMTIQVGIDGYRLIADRTGKYAPGPEPCFVYDETGKPETATAYVEKMTPDGTWHTAAATAHYSEYCGLTKDGKPNHMWASKPHIMLGKCAEALALRRAFPAELSGVYTPEEMDQADNPPVVIIDPPQLETPEPQPQPEPPPPRAPSDSRKKVNTNLWTIFWEKAQAADLDGDAIWAAVKAVRPDLLKRTPKSKGVAQGIINNLTDEDFAKLFAGLEAFQRPPDDYHPDPEEQARAEAEAEAADERAALQEHDPDTGEVYP